MANKQIHELAELDAPATTDELLVSAGSGHEARRLALADLPMMLPLADGRSRRVADRALDIVSVRDFGALGDGTADDSAAFLSAFASGIGTILVPAGTYLLKTPLNAPPGLRLVGSGRAATTLQADHEAGLLTVAADANGDCHATIEHISFTISGSGGGLVLRGKDVTLANLAFRGGSPEGWAIDLVDSRAFRLDNIVMGGVGGDILTCNGIRLRNSDPSNNAANFGDGSLRGIDIKLGVAGTTGIHLWGAETRLINNVGISQSRIFAPSGGPAPLDGTTGIRLDSCVRCSFIGISLEALALGIVEQGIASGLGACVANQYLGVSAINVTQAYADSNALVARSVQQRIFLGCDNFPATTSLNDGDTIVPAGLWLQSYVSGENAVRMRCFSGGELILDDGAEAGALSLDVGGSSPRIAPKQSSMLVRLYVGRGSSPQNNTMRDVTIEPVLRLAPRDTENPAPTNGQIAYADGVNWNPGKGAGFYAREEGQWRKLAYA